MRLNKDMQLLVLMWCKIFSTEKTTFISDNILSFIIIYSRDTRHRKILIIVGE